MKWALNRERADRKYAVAFADLTKQQAERLLLAYLELEQAEKTK
jgi:hypothetical protein